MQDEDFARGLFDIAYNFVVSEFGIIEGRGWDNAAEGLIDLQKEFGIGFFPMAENSTDFVNQLIMDGIVIGKLRGDIKTICDPLLCQDQIRHKTIDTVMKKNASNAVT